MYILMNKDIPIMKLQFDNELYTCKEIEPINLDYGPLYLYLQQDHLKQAFMVWIKDRIPRWNEILHRKEIIRDRLVNLSDHYWMKEENENIQWKDITPFQNDFLTGMYPSPDKNTNGMVPKHWTIQKGKRILVKESCEPFNREAKNEAIASLLLQALCLPKVRYEEKNNCSYCETFVTNDTELIPAWQVLGVSYKEKNESEYSYFFKCCDALHIPVTKTDMANMLLFDWLIFNNDRHYNNFGFIRNIETGKYLGLAPWYDHGNSLWFDKPSSKFHITYQPCMPFGKNFERQQKFMKEANLELDLLNEDIIKNIMYRVWGKQAEEKPIQKMMNLLCYHLKKMQEWYFG